MTASFTMQLGKGWREPCPPYHSVNVFGAALGSPLYEQYNCMLEIVDPAQSFDLASISPYHEVVVALLQARGIYPGTYISSFTWYRDRDGAILYRYVSPPSYIGTDWFHTLSYIGWIPAEINENGSYRVEVEITGPNSAFVVSHFTITGTPQAPPLGGVIGIGYYGILDAFNLASAWCHSIYLQVLDWLWPFYLLATPFYSLSTIFNGAARSMGEFILWLEMIAGYAMQVFSWDYIKSLILTWLPELENIHTWFSAWYAYFQATIYTWWLTAQTTVHGWIAFATEGLSTLRASWDEFTTSTLPNLLSLDWLFTWWDSRILDIQNLINTAFILRDSLWSGWDTWRDSVAEFFANPVQYVWERCIDWFLGPEEK